MADLAGGAARRTARLASLPLGAASRFAWATGQRLGGAPAEAVSAEVQARAAAQIFGVLGELKGGAMKVGQAMSVMEAALPEEMAGPYRETLVRLQEQAPPLPERTVRRTLAERLGTDWADRFQHLDLQPSAAASLGQVHRGVWHDGTPCALKLQYPGADAALRADLVQLRRLSRVLQPFVGALDVREVVAELEERVAEELDYHLEAEAQRAFAAGYVTAADDPEQLGRSGAQAEVVVPRVLDVADGVLVSEWLEGTGLSRVIAQGTREERDRAGLLYVRFLLASPDVVGLLHADPHPGNFRITPDGRLGVLDYGAAARLPAGTPTVVGAVTRAVLDDDGRRALEGLRAEGFLPDGSDVEPDDVVAYLRPFVEPLMGDEFHFSREWLRAQAARVSDPRLGHVRTGRAFALPREYVLLHRVTLGTLGVLAQLDAVVPVRAEAERWLPAFADA